jgi:hypothetical protein
MKTIGKMKAKASSTLTMYCSTVELVTLDARLSRDVRGL